MIFHRFVLQEEEAYNRSSRGQRVSVTDPRFQDKGVTDEAQKSLSSILKNEGWQALSVKGQI